MQETLRLQLDLRRDGMAADVGDLASAVMTSAQEVSYGPGQSIYEVPALCLSLSAASCVCGGTSTALLQHGLLCKA